MDLLEIFRNYEVNFLLAQLVGLVTAILAIFSVQLKTMKNVLMLGIFSNLFTVINYWLLGEMSGAWVCLIAIVHTVWIYNYNRGGKRFPKRLNYVFIALYSAAVALTFGGLYDVLAWIAAMAFAVAVVQVETSRYRLIIVVNSLAWIIYDLLTRSYTMAISHSLIFISAIIGIYRLDIKKKPLGEAEPVVLEKIAVEEVGESR